MGEVKPKDASKDQPPTTERKPEKSPDVSNRRDDRGQDKKPPENKGDGRRPEGGESSEKKGSKEETKERKPEQDVTKKKDERHPSDFKSPPNKEKAPGKDAPPTKDQQKAKDAPKDKPKELSKDAKEIIRKAKDESKPIAERAKEAVRDILKKYYPDAKVKDIVYKENTKGLEAERGNKDGKIIVGKDFVDRIDRFNNRINQVGHEKQHIDQYRQGMNDSAEKNRSHEREYKAHQWQSRAPDREGGPGTSHTDRANHADKALREYDKMPNDDKQKYSKEAEELRKYEAEERRKGGNQPPPRD